MTSQQLQEVQEANKAVLSRIEKKTTVVLFFPPHFFLSFLHTISSYSPLFFSFLTFDTPVSETFQEQK